MSTSQLPRFDLNDIRLEDRIGRGQFSVYKAMMAGKAIAVKKMDCDKNEIPREVKVHSSLPPHPHISTLLGIAHNKQGFSIYLCMELANKSLHQYLHMEMKKPLIQHGTRWAVQITRGMHHLHQHGIAHRDLKSANVLLFENEHVAKVSDFGSARQLDHTTTVTGATGTYRWMAPEFDVEASTKINQRCDLFSYGMVLYEIFAQKVPFADIDEGYEVVKCIRDGKRPSLPLNLPPFFKEVIQSCWETNPQQRPTFEELLQNGQTLLHRAAQSGDAEAVQQLIENRFDVNSRTEQNGISPLYLASYEGHTKVVDTLLKSGADPNLAATISPYCAPLGVAAQKGNIEIVERLLEGGAETKHQNKDSCSALYLASQSGHRDVVDTLLKHGATPNQEPHNPLRIAAQKGHTQTVETLLRGGSHVNQKNENGFTALYLASEFGHTDVVDALLKSGADPNMPTTVSPYSVPLGIAAERGHTETVARLLKGKSFINHKDKLGRTALYFASWKCHVEVVKKLTEQRADVNICDVNDGSPLYVASQEGHNEIVDILLRKKANPNHVTKSGETALSISGKKEHLEVVRLLQKSGAREKTRKLQKSLTQRSPSSRDRRRQFAKNKSHTLCEGAGSDLDHSV